MVSNVSNRNFLPLNVISSVIGITFVTLALYLYKSGSFSEFTRPYAPPGQTLYIFSKVTAMFVYLLMWWQIMLGILKKVNTKTHMLLGVSTFVLILTHVLLFISAVSIRQQELNIDMLMPGFTVSYYKTGLSLGVIAFFLIILATASSILKNRLQKFWKLGHGLVYLAFILGTVHGLMIGSEVNKQFFTYITYGAILSIFFVFIYKSRTLLFK